MYEVVNVDTLSRKATDLAVALRIVRGLVATALYGVAFAFLVIIVPGLFDSWSVAGIRFTQYLAEFFVDVNPLGFASKVDLNDISLVAEVSKDGVVFWILGLVLLVCVSLFKLLLYFFFYRKLLAFSRGTAAVILFVIGLIGVFSAVGHAFAARFATNIYTHWIFLVFAGCLFGYPTILVLRGAWLVAFTTEPFKKRLLASPAVRTSFMIRPKEAKKELYRSMSIVHRANVDRTSEKKVFLLCLAALLFEGYAYMQYLSIGTYISQSAIKWAGPSNLSWFTGTSIGYAGLLATLVVISLGIGRASLGISRVVRRVARRSAMLSAGEIRALDPRPPILFLRPFIDDQISLRQARIVGLAKFFDPGIEARNLEQILVEEFSDIGPVIAIGNPADKLPPLGAAREYVGADSWKSVVEKLIEESRYIVIAFSNTPNLAWELQTVRDKNLLKKTMVILPPSATTDVEQADTIRQCLGVTDRPIGATHDRPNGATFSRGFTPSNGVD